MVSASNTASGAPKREMWSPLTHTILSEIFWARSISCSDMMTVMPFCFAMPRSMLSNCSLCRMSKNEVGSSSMMISGSWQMARASSTRWRWPSEMALKSRPDRSSACTARMASSTCRSSSADSTPSRPVYG